MSRHLDPDDVDAIRSVIDKALAEHGASDERMKIVLERIESATRRLKKEIRSSDELVAKLFYGIRDGRSGPVVRMEPLGEEREALSEASHPLIGIVGRGSGVETILRVQERVFASHLITSLLCIGVLLIVASKTRREVDR